MELNGRTEWFRTSLIVRKILDYFSSEEILSFSLVNPIWNIEAKSLLKVRGETGARMGTIKPGELVRSIASVSDELREAATTAEFANAADEGAGAQFVAPLRNSDANACEDVMNFSRLIQSMAVIPFCKFKIHIRDHHAGPCQPFDESAFRSIVEAVPITSLSFSVFKSPDGRSSCNALRFLELLLAANANQLRELFIGAPTELNLDPDAMLNACNFSQLRVLIFDVCDLPQRPTLPEMLFLRSIVERAANLDYLELQQSLENHPRDLDENKMDYSLVQNLFEVVLHDSRSPEVELVLPQDPWEAWKLSEIFLNRLQVRYLGALPGFAGPADLDARTVLFKNSCGTLMKADLDLLSLATALQNRIPFPNMQELSLEYYVDYLFMNFGFLKQAILWTRPWSQCFPNLQKLMYKIHDESFAGDELEDQLQDVLENLLTSKEETEPDRLNTVRELEVHGSMLETAEIDFLCNLCPFVEKLTAAIVPSKITRFWSYLTGIEFMELDPILMITEDEHLDCFLCGVSPAELKELQGKDAEFLKSLHIVPNGTPITHLKHLTTLQFDFQDFPDGEQYYGFSFSKVSAGLAFSRMPNLSISIRLSRPRSLNGEEHGYETILNDFPKLNLSVQVVYEEDDDE